MVRADHYSHLDDPFSYFRRLESYASSRTQSFSRPHSYANSPRLSASPVKIHPYADSRQCSEIHTRHESDVRSQSEPCATPQTRSHITFNSLSYTSEKPSGRRSNKANRQYTPSSTSRTCWTRRRKISLLVSLVVLSIIGIIIIVVVRIRETAFNYTPSYAQVTNEKAFASGGATNRNPNDTSDGIGPGQDEYRYYSGGPEDFPSSSTWVSFDDMWQANLPGIQSSCTDLGYGSDDSSSEIQDIYNAVQDRANASYVDHRFILAVILQESHGCVHVSSTSSNSGVRNPGLMQSHNGHSFSSWHESLSILAMVQDGTQGTEYGPGLVQNLNSYGNPYSAARAYNSGIIAKNGNLSEGVGATACYVSDVANRLTGWVNAKSTCPGDDQG